VSRHDINRKRSIIDGIRCACWVESSWVESNRVDSSRLELRCVSRNAFGLRRTSKLLHDGCGRRLQFGRPLYVRDPVKLTDKIQLLVATPRKRRHASLCGTIFKNIGRKNSWILSVQQIRRPTIHRIPVFDQTSWCLIIYGTTSVRQFATDWCLRNVLIESLLFNCWNYWYNVFFKLSASSLNCSILISQESLFAPPE
jgi:hypothetical protein